MSMKRFFHDLHVGLNERTAKMLFAACSETGESMSVFVRRALKESFQREGISAAPRPSVRQSSDHHGQRNKTATAA